MKQMKFKINEIPNGKSKYHYVLTSHDLDLGDYEENFRDVLNIQLIIERNGVNIVFSGNVKTNVYYICSRCLNPIIEKLDEDFKFFFSKEVDSNKENLYYDIEENIINAGIEVKDTIILEIKSKPLCRIDCKGLCPYCKVDKNSYSCLCEESIKISGFKTIEELRKRWNGGDNNGTT
jgi:uncharacterized protein